MTTQPTLWGYSSTTARQGELFPRGGRVSDLTCECCGTPLEHTPGGWITCPKGCGKLREAAEPADAEPSGDGSGLWFHDDEFSETT